VNDITQHNGSLNVTIDGRGSSAEADCLDCLVALPAAVERMRAAATDGDLPESMINRTRDAFIALDGRDRSSVLMVAAAAGC